MKHYVFVLIFVPMLAFSQTNVGIGTTTPDASAKLDVSSSTQGLLIPRMTEAQRNAIVSPATGLMIYQTSNLIGTYYYDGAQWLNLSDNLGDHTATQILNMDTNKIVNVPAPVNGLDAVNKDYVDAAVAGGGGGGGVGPGNVTELSSQSGTWMSFSAALTYCDSMTQGGNSDWRLPARDEILYLISGGGSPAPPQNGNMMWTITMLEEPSNNTSGCWRHYAAIATNGSVSRPTQCGCSGGSYNMTYSDCPRYVMCVR